MKLNRGMLVASAVTTVAALGLVAVNVVGFDRAPDSDDPHVAAEMAATEQTAPVDGDTAPADNAGVEQYRGGSAARGGAVHAGGAARGGGFHGGAVHGGGFDRGYGRGAGYGRGGWGGASRWGRWGGGHYVGGRWVDGPYNGWCDGRYYACNRAWW